MQDYILKETIISKKGTWLLTFTDSGFRKIRSDFKETDKYFICNKKFSHDSYVWTVYIWKNLKIWNSDGDSIPSLRVFGVCRDYTFGSYPSYYYTKLSGNKKAAKSIITQLIDYYPDLDCIE